MSFVAALKRSAISDDGTKAYLLDVTGNYGNVAYEEQEDGTYEQVTNTTGYGVENNVVLSDYARIVYGLFYDLNKEEEVLLPDAYLASDANVSEFAMPTPYDGYYTWHMLLVPIDTGAALTEGDIVYVQDLSLSPYGGRLEKFVGGQRVVVQNSELPTLSANNILISQTSHDGFLNKLNIAYNRLVGRLKDWESGIISLDYQKAEHILNRLDVMMTAFSQAWVLFQYSEMTIIASKNKELIKLANSV